MLYFMQLATCMYYSFSHLFVGSYISEDISHSNCLNQSHNKTDVVSNAEEYPCHLEDSNDVWQ